ncbi:hypothetical protein GCM10010272_32160 [Streptomyces lateritius]|nr:hypothetical protein GCM10010272_32160 [Streptomyces lateritius]
MANGKSTSALAAVPGTWKGRTFAMSVTMSALSVTAARQRKVKPPPGDVPRLPVVPGRETFAPPSRSAGRKRLSVEGP